MILSNIGLDTFVDIDFNAKVDGKPISLKGNAGPISNALGKGNIAIDFNLSVLNELKIKLKGDLIDPKNQQAFDLYVESDSFSPKKLFAAINQPFPIQTSNPDVLETILLKATLKGNPKMVSLSNGVVKMDDSNLKFSLAIKEFNKPNIAFNLELDKIDLDQYIPKTNKAQNQSKQSNQKQVSKSTKRKTDYTLLRNIILDGKINIKKLKTNGAILEDIVIKALAKNGIITLDPVLMNLYEGSMTSSAIVNVKKKNPETNIKLETKGIQVGPLIKDTTRKEKIEGALNAFIKLSMTGESPEMIKKTLNGNGRLSFVNGAIIGIDLAATIRNIKTKLGVNEKTQGKTKNRFC